MMMLTMVKHLMLMANGSHARENGESEDDDTDEIGDRPRSDEMYEGSAYNVNDIDKPSIMCSRGSKNQKLLFYF